MGVQVDDYGYPVRLRLPGRGCLTFMAAQCMSDMHSANIAP